MIEHARSKDLFVNCDLLAFMETDTPQDVKILEQDLNIMLDFVKPDHITIAPMFQKFSIFNKYFGVNDERIKDKEVNKCLDLIFSLNRSVLNVVEGKEVYYFFNTPSLSKEEVLPVILNDIEISKIPIEEFRKNVRSLSCSSYPFNPKHQNLLAIRGWGKRSLYSYIGEGVYYITINEDWTPKFLVRSIENDKQEIERIKNKVS